ncbi:hypothetical protein CLOM_g16752 [Closterium sp. NIES-68]|nr:hypothetical protein CLOM_g16752 [Closterium sp. NIES-68]GJP73217.1 hypothetical protein CLOP_g3956 [Closterium sp. NIES-67]
MNVSNRTLEALVALGAKIEPILEPVPYPFAVTADRLAINKPCRYSKLLMWNMVKYRKLIYLDSDLLVLQSIDDLFQRPQLSAAPDTLPPDKFNSGLMVVEPNRAMFKDMLSKIATLISPNVGDQGFLNSYFSSWYQQGPLHHIDYTYNALVRISVSPGWRLFIEPKLKVLHFSGNTKPWNMMVDRQFPTTRAFDHRWWEVYDDVYSILHRQALKASSKSSSASSSFNSRSTLDTTAAAAAAAAAAAESAGGGGGGGGGGSLEGVATAARLAAAAAAAAGSPSEPPQLAPQCQRNYMAYARKPPITDKFSVIINCFDRFDLMLYFVRRYARFEFVHKVYIVWGNTRVTPFHPSFFNVSKPVEILYSGIDSLNDRFKPIRSLETEAVLMCDDDIEVHSGALRVAFERWQEEKYRLVGFFPRAHYREVNGPRKGHMTYVLTPRQEYSIVLTKMFLMHGDYLRAYTCIMPQRVREYVERNKNCEDITMNFVVTQLSGLPPLLMEDPTKLDYGTSSGLSSRGSHDNSRSVCMNDIAIMLGYMSLRNTSEAVTYFERDKMVKVVRRRRLSTAAHMVFEPVFDAFEHRGSKQFLKQLTFQHPLITTEIAEVPTHSVNRHVMCIKGDNDEDMDDPSRNQYTLLDFASVPPDAGHLSGSTFIAHSQWGFEGRFTLLHLTSSLATWRRSHGCFGPARLMLFQDGMLRTQVSAWASNLLKAVLGPGAAPPFKPPDGVTPQCLESAVVLRQRDTFNADECSSDAQELRRIVRAFCHTRVPAVPSAEDPPALLGEEGMDVRIAFAGDADNWARMPWLNFSLAATWIRQECAVFSLSCEVATVPRGEFCRVKVLGLGRADIVIGPWGDRAMDNIIFLLPGTAVLELYPSNAHEEDRKTAKLEAECLDLAYEQMRMDVAMKDVLSWVSKHLETLGRRQKGGKEDSEPTFLESCVHRNLRY